MRKVGGGESICLGLAKAPSAVLVSCQMGDFVRLLTVAGQTDLCETVLCHHGPVPWLWSRLESSLLV
jgi:hypothetical protein